MFDSLRGSTVHHPETAGLRIAQLERMAGLVLLDARLCSRGTCSDAASMLIEPPMLCLAPCMQNIPGLAESGE